jgi:hypothetical protein
MTGRSPACAVSDVDHPRNLALAIALNDRCDAVVATIVRAQHRPDAIEPSVIAFLNGDEIIQWATVTLGL